MTRWLILATALAAATAPLLPERTAAPPPPVEWPATFEGRALTPIAPAAVDAVIARDFPGRIARFSDGRRQIVLRSVTTPTRQLHSARDCFAAIGYAVTPAPMRDSASCFIADRSGKRVRVCERITDAAGTSFAEVSSWFWPALLGNSKGPWLAATTVEPIG